jgi:hypothetical protein
MNQVRQFLALSPADRKLVLRAVGLVTAARIALWVMPFRRARRVMESRRISQRLATIPVRRLSWAVQAAGRRVPRASCLVQALALNRLMADAGRSSELHIGVARGHAQGLDAHAWVEHRNHVILGDNGELGRYSRILTMGASIVRS